ncbi:hypothetical protein R9C00_10625 [Flammeovirgaceae bacterium SG7u.111]|nr:hypothetical protein [Flammeovirgaceae bacterium SG7u.132]WPO37906.1 hypothetical protein R9C00_10625 [Flammeovirgaceae bacterium SG7u.111]
MEMKATSENNDRPVRYIGDTTGLVEDCIQEVFIYLRKKKANLGNTNSIRFYLYKALHSKILRTLSGKSKMFVSSNLLEGYNFQLNLSYKTLLIKNQIDEDARYTPTIEYHNGTFYIACIEVENELDACHLSTETAEGFTGCLYGMYAFSAEDVRGLTATYNWFEYEGND